MGTYSRNLKTRIERKNMAMAASGWDHLNMICENTRTNLIKITQTVTQGKQFLEYRNAFNGESVVLVDSILQSIQNASLTFNQTKQRHAGKLGPVKNPEELNEVTNLAQDYFLLFENVMIDTSRVLPRLQEIVTLEELRARGEAVLAPLGTANKVEVVEGI